VRRGADRILLIAPQPFYEPRGTPMNVLQMCRVLTGAGYAVDLATFPLGRDVAMPGLEIHRAPRLPGISAVPIGFSKRKLALDASLALLVLGLVARRRYRLVHAVEEAVFLALPLTWLGLPLVYDLDSSISHQLAYTGVLGDGPALRSVRALERLALRRARAAITVCQALTDAARELSPGTPVFQVEDAPLEESLRAPDPARVEALRAQHGLAGRRAVVYTGNLESYQGLDLLLAAAPRVRARVPRVAFALVGGEPAQVQAFAGRVRAAGLADTVFPIGARPPAEMPEWMALGELLVSPRTQGQNTPLKIYTYMSSGRPIVATDLETHTQVLDAGCAALCPPTPEGLAEALAGALEHPERTAPLARAARRKVEAEYGPEAFRRKLLAAYEAVAPLPGARFSARSASMYPLPKGRSASRRDQSQASG
jgi:glycosyltransferase involved in cell wall biosynthesis